ncbi:substrate-binding domain-containing protein [Streptomyces sp. NPDC006129]|uniref:substrate-binding domain-containing protein n=1 Tax=Streptomyces sp. NPDC006129 TaxID=3155348 RepID=UPI0033B36AC1
MSSQAGYGRTGSTAICGLGGRSPRPARRRPPSPICLVGYDNIPEAAYVWPPSTTVRQDFGEAGRRARELLVTQIEGEPRTGTLVAGARTGCTGQQRPSCLTAESERADLPGLPARPSRGATRYPATTQPGSTRRPPFGVGRGSAVSFADAGQSPTLISADGRS